MVKSIPIQDLDIANMPYDTPIRVHCPADPEKYIRDRIDASKTNLNLNKKKIMSELIIKIKAEGEVTSEVLDKVMDAYADGLISAKYTDGVEFSVETIDGGVPTPKKKRAPRAKAPVVKSIDIKAEVTAKGIKYDINPAVNEGDPDASAPAKSTKKVTKAKAAVAPVVVESPAIPSIDSDIDTIPAVEKKASTPVTDNPLMSIPTV